MSIVITVQKTVNDNGVLGYTVTEIKALTRAELPDAYVNGKYSCYLSQDFLCCGKFGMGLKVGRFYDRDEFDKYIGFIVKCGKALAEIRAQAAAARANWHGEVEFVI